MAIQNDLNLTTSGIVAADGNGAFTGRTITGTADFIDSTNGSGVGGNPTLSINTKFEETGMHGWNGSLLQSAAVTAASDGATITFSVELSGGGDLDVVFSDGYYSWDTSPADTVTLTAGTDTVPVLNYVYFLQSTKVLTASTAGWPATEHAPLATVLCQSAASFQTDGAYKFHAWTDHVVSNANEGHINDINFWIRKQPATYESGVNQTFSITPNGGAPDNVILTTTSGVVLQLHDQTFPAFSGTPDIYVVNDSVTPYTKITDLNAITADSTGASLVGKYYSLVIWGCVSESSSDCKLFCNLPSGSYNNPGNVTADASRYANFDIPDDFLGTGFLIAQWNLRYQSGAGGTWTSVDEIDLRGLKPAINPGGGAAFPTEFIDSTFRILDDGDNSKEIAFQASGITTATTRTLTVQDADGTLALTSETGGGTNQTSYATGDILYASASNTLSKLTAGSNTQVLTLAAGVPSWAAPTVGTVTSVSGTTNRVSSTGGATPVIDIDAAYVGQTSLTTLGTITTGTWNGTDIAVADGGTGRGTATAYAVLCGGTVATGPHQSIASVGTSGQVLTSNGAGALPTFQAAGIVSPVTVPDGGTGLTTITDHGIMLGSGVGTVTPTAAPGDGQLLVGAASADPNLLTSWMQQGNNCWFWNLSFTHAAGTLTLAGA